MQGHLQAEERLCAEHAMAVVLEAKPRCGRRAKATATRPRLYHPRVQAKVHRGLFCDQPQKAQCR